MSTVATWLGYWFAFLVAAGVLLSASWLILGVLAREVFLRLRRVYALYVIGYWLDRLEREGWRVFPKARDESAAIPKQGTPYDL